MQGDGRQEIVLSDADAGASVPAATWRPAPSAVSDDSSAPPGVRGRHVTWLDTVPFLLSRPLMTLLAVARPRQRERAPVNGPLQGRSLVE